MDCNITEAGREVLEQEGKLEALSLDVRQAKSCLIIFIGDLGGRGNELGLKFGPQDAERAQEKVEAATPGIIHRLLTEWLPKALTDEGVKILFQLLGLG